MRVFFLRVRNLHLPEAGSVILEPDGRVTPDGRTPILIYRSLHYIYCN